jgi:hypothetical protein
MAGWAETKAAEEVPVNASISMGRRRYALGAFIGASLYAVAARYLKGDWHSGDGRRRRSRLIQGTDGTITCGNEIDHFCSQVRFDRLTCGRRRLEMDVCSMRAKDRVLL